MNFDHNKNPLVNMDAIKLPKFEQCSKECKEYFELGIRHDFNLAISKLDDLSSESIYHATAQLILSKIRHMLTLDKVNCPIYYVDDFEI